MTTHVLGDTSVLTSRSLRHILRSPDTIITTAVTPIALMLLFVYVLGGAINTGSDESYVNYMLPGILLIAIASGVAYTAYRGPWRSSSKTGVRSWAADPRKSGGAAMVGKSLYAAALNDTGPLRLGRHSSEWEGWRSLGVGLAQAIANVDRHRIQVRDDVRRYAMGVVGRKPSADAA